MSEPTSPATNPAATKGRSSKGAAVGGGVAVAVLAAAGGAYALGAFDGLTGGGKQPADVIPSTSVAYMRIDLNPSAAQKVGAFRLVDKLPEAKTALTSTDPKRAVFEWAQKDTDLKSIDYTNDIEPWLGDRIGVGLLPATASGSEPVPVIAVEVKDEARAEEGLKKLESVLRPALDAATEQVEQTVPGASISSSGALGGSDESVRIYTDGYALIVLKDAEAQVREQLQGERLADNANFSGDMDALGDEGVASAWYDQAGLMKNVNPGSTPAVLDDLAQKSGRSALGLRVAADYLELATVSRDVQQPTVPAVTGLDDLPADTGAVYSFAGGEQILTEYWPTLLSVLNASGATAVVQQAENALGITLPDDLATLLGKQFDVVLAKQDLANVDAGSMQVAARLTTDTAKAEQIIDGLQQELAATTPAGDEIPRKTVGETLLIGADAAYLDKLQNPEGKLSDNQGFQRTVPDLAQQAAVLFIDLDAFENQYLNEVPEDKREFMQAIQAIGVVGEPVHNGESRGSLRLSVN